MGAFLNTLTYYCQVLLICLHFYPLELKIICTSNGKLVVTVKDQFLQDINMQFWMEWSLIKSVYFDQCLCFPVSRGKKLPSSVNWWIQQEYNGDDFRFHSFFPISIPKSLYFDIFSISFNGLEITIIYYHISNIFFVLVSLHCIMLLITGWKRVT